jgi:2-hydroxychromene-2-carboxylate isomerase
MPIPDRRRMPPRIEFYFDFASPYGYLAASRVGALAERTGCDVVWQPVFLAIVHHLTKSQSFFEFHPMRRAYFFEDIERSARFHGVELRIPKKLPINSLSAARAYYWRLDQAGAAAAVRTAQALMRAYWVDGREIEGPEAVAAVLADLDIPRDETMAALADPRVKARLKAETEASIDKGVFGSPFFIVDGQRFWGGDRMDQLEWQISQNRRPG